MNEVIESKILRHRIENIGSLPTAPETLKKLFHIMEKQNVSLAKVAGFVQSDPALTFRILKMVNSAVCCAPCGHTDKGWGGLGFSGDQIVPMVDDTAFYGLELLEQEVIDVFQELEQSIEVTREVLQL